MIINWTKYLSDQNSSYIYINIKHKKNFIRSKDKTSCFIYSEKWLKIYEGLPLKWEIKNYYIRPNLYDPKGVLNLKNMYQSYSVPLF